MGSNLETILSILPKIEKVVVRGEADYYGLSHLIAKKNKQPFIPRSLSGWKHGWLSSNLKYTEQFTSGALYSKFLVSLVEHEVFLNEKGIKAKAVGMPFIYIEDVETQKITRQENTLLVMPPHSLPYTNHSWDEESYAKKINDLKNKFDLIVVCLHQSCVESGLWMNAFKKYNISWIIGADAQDKNSLIRMYRIFNSFEFMTTNAIGSHVVYAAYCGCKVSIYGEYVEFSKENYTSTPIYKKFPFLLEYNLKHSSYQYINKVFPFLFASPEKAELRVEWAEEQLGKSNKVTFKELSKLLGWNLHDQTIFIIEKVYSKIKKMFSWK
jgi:hypothetical protein